MIQEAEKIKEKKRRLVAVAFGSALLILTLAFIAAFSWFALSGDDGSKAFSLSAGKVQYTMASADQTFYSAFELEQDDYQEDDFNDEDGYLPATGVESVLANGEVISYVNDTYVYSMMHNTKIRLSASLIPAGATDVYHFSSSNEQVITVSAYGTVRAVGPAGSSAGVTMTISDRNPAVDRRAEDFTVTVLFSITENTTEDSNQYGYLPGNVNVLRGPMEVKNYSNVASKLRIRLDWTYSDYTTEDADLNEYKAYTVEQINALAGPGALWENVSVVANIRAPLSLEALDHWQVVPPESNLKVADNNGDYWTATTLSLRDSDKAALITALQTTGGSFQLTEKMIDSAYLYVAYSDETISSATAEYGTSIGKNSLTDGTVIPALRKLTTSSSYASFSTRKVFVITVTLQARQAMAYRVAEELNWYNVYCTKENLGETQHAPTAQKTP